MYGHKFHVHSTLRTNPISLPWSVCFSTLHTDNFTHPFSLNLLYFPIFHSQLMTLPHSYLRKYKQWLPLSVPVLPAVKQVTSVAHHQGQQSQDVNLHGLQVSGSPRKTQFTRPLDGTTLHSQREETEQRSASVMSIGPPWPAHLIPQPMQGDGLHTPLLCCR